MDNDKINKIAETIVRLETILNEIVVPQSKLSVSKWHDFEKLDLKKHLDLNQANSKKIDELNVRIVYIESTRKEEMNERARIRTLINKSKNQNELQLLMNPVWHVHNGVIPQEDTIMSFSMLLNLVEASNADSKELLWKFIKKYKKDMSEKDHIIFDNLVGYAIKYFNDVIKLQKKYKKPDSNEKIALEALVKTLDDCNDAMLPEDIQTLIYSTGKENGYSENLRDWFKLIYEVVFGDENGPRMGFFISFFGVNETKKLITEELIDKRLEDKGVKFDIDHDEALKAIQDHYDFKLTDNWNETPCYSIYTESTADGYEVWVATSGDGRNVCINEDVHYYENDLSEKLAEAMTDYNSIIYVDDLDSYYVQDAVTEIYDEYVNDMKQEVENELIEEGYEHEKTEQA